MYDPSNNYLSFHHYNIMELLENFKSIEFLVILRFSNGRKRQKWKIGNLACLAAAFGPHCVGLTYPKEGILCLLKELKEGILAYFIVLLLPFLRIAFYQAQLIFNPLLAN